MPGSRGEAFWLPHGGPVLPILDGCTEFLLMLGICFEHKKFKKKNIKKKQNLNKTKIKVQCSN